MKNNHVISLSFTEDIPKNPFQYKIAKSRYSGQYYTFFGPKQTQNDVIYSVGRGYVTPVKSWDIL